MAYKIKYSSKDQFYTQASKRFNAWTAELIYAQNILDSLANLESFQGEAGDAVKTYFGEVHGFLLKAIRQTIDDFYCRLALFAYGYYDIDGQYDAVLPEESFAEFQSQMNSENNYVYDMYAKLSGILTSIQDILPLSKPYPSSLMDSIKEANSRIDNLSGRICAYESSKQAEATGELGSLLNSLSAAISSLARSGGDISGYHAGGYASDPTMRALEQSIATSKTNTSKFIDALNDIIEGIGEVTVEPGQDDLIPPQIDGIIEQQGRTVITAAEKLANGGIFPFLIALNSGRLTVNTSGSGLVEKTDKSIKGALLYGQSVTTEEFLGGEVSTTAYGDLGGASAGYSTYGSFSTKNKDSANPSSKFKPSLGFGVKGNAEVHGANGKISADSDYLDAGVEGTVLGAGVEGKFGVSITDGGKFSPHIQLEGSGKAFVADGEVEVAVGDELNNVHGKAEGTLLGAEASAGVGAGKIHVKDKNTGVERDMIGVKAEAKAEAYAAEGRLSGGIEFLGIDISFGVEGKAGGAGAGVGGYVGTGGVSGELDVGVVFGVGIDFSVDWTGFEWPFGKKK